MVFYNLVFFRGDHWDSGGGRDNRYLIIAANRGVADYLFRLLQERGDPVNRKADFHELKRMSPQMWSWCGENERVLYNFIENVNLGKANLPQRVSNRIRGKVFFQGLGSWDNSARMYPILPDLDVADHINGRIFCIRNKRVPERYWSSDTKGNIVISTVKRAKFRIEIDRQDKPSNVDELLMVPWDNVCLKLMRQATEQDQNHGEYPVTMNNNDGSLVAKFRRPWYFKLGDLFTGRFGIAIQEKREAADPETIVPVFVDNEYEGGEVWELC